MYVRGKEREKERDGSECGVERGIEMERGAQNTRNRIQIAEKSEMLS